ILACVVAGWGICGFHQLGRETRRRTLENRGRWRLATATDERGWRIYSSRLEPRWCDDRRGARFRRILSRTTVDHEHLVRPSEHSRIRWEDETDCADIAARWFPGAQSNRRADFWHGRPHLLSRIRSEQRTRWAATDHDPFCVGQARRH